MSDEDVDLWLEEVVGKFTTLSRNFMSQLIRSWKTMHDMTNEKKEEKMNNLMLIFKDVYVDLCEEEQSKSDILLKKVHACLEEQVQLRQELNVHIPDLNNIKKPLEPLLADLEESLEKFRKEREERLKKLNKLIDEENELCQILGIASREHNLGVPSDAEFSEIEQRIFDLHHEKFDREQLVMETREKLKDLLDILEREPTSQFEFDLFSESPFAITEENISHLKDLENEVLAEKLEVEGEKIRLLKKLNILWDKIRAEEAYRRQFVESHPGIGKSTITAIQTEIERCEEVRLANLKPLIKSARDDIAKLWNLCAFSEEQKMAFSPFYMNRFDEDILALHELERDKWDEFYQINKPIFDLVNTWQDLWDRLLLLEEKAKDKKRLFDNRGGQLLREEKERKTMDRKLPKVYNELKHLLETFKEKNGKTFLYNGVDLLAKINMDIEKRDVSKPKKTVEPKTPTRLAGRTTPNVSKWNNYSQSSAKSQHTTLSNASSNSGFKTPSRSRPISPMSDLSNASVASYSVFQEEIEAMNAEYEKPKTRGTRNVNGKRNGSPIRLRSSPINKKNTRNTPMKRPGTTPLKSTPMKRPCLTPASSRIATPLRVGVSSNKKATPSKENTRTLRFTPARSKFPINL